MKIDGKQFMNLQEAVGWLLENNALPFQSTNVFVGDTEISKATIINPSPAQIRVGALVLFSDGKVGTVSAITSNSFMVDSNYTDLANIAKYITAVTVDASGHLIVTLSDGSSVDAGILKQIQRFAMSGTDLIAYYNDGTSYNCGPIFVGSLTLPADLTVTDDLEVGGNSTFMLPATFNGNVTIGTGKDLIVGGNATFQTTDFNDVADFNDETNFNARVTFRDDVSINGVTTLNSDLTLVNSSIVADDLSLAGELSVTNNASIGGNLTVIGDIECDDLQVNSDATIDINLNVGGSLTVTGSINGEPNPSVKPIYCHPLTFGQATPSEFFCTMLIFNNDPTPFTFNTFNAWLTALQQEITNVRIMASGYIVISGTLYPLSYLAATSTYRTLICSPQSISGKNIQFPNADWEALSLATFNDGVNKIN